MSYTVTRCSERKLEGDQQLNMHGSVVKGELEEIQMNTL